MLGRNTARWAAITLLLLAGLDTAFPSLCRAESLPALASVAQARLSEAGSEPDGAEQSPEEDCFCCCAHLRPEPILLGVEPLARLSGAPTARPSLDPKLRVRPFFHPPRL